jgi:hypothetical protein
MTIFIVTECTSPKEFRREMSDPTQGKKLEFHAFLPMEK